MSMSASAFALLLLVLPASVAHARNLMSADGPGGMPTYDLLRQAYTTELPDCGHMVPHITEEPDSELGKNVFVFHAHVNQDDDRCGGTDRQRTEIRARAADIVANNGETVYYRWKFKLATGFQGTPSFTHIFQIKSDLGAPIMTLTPRVSTFEITGRGGTGSSRTELAKFIGVWVVVDLKVLYSDNGRVELSIRRLSDGQMLYSHSGGADMWDANASAHDSKFGIYRSLNNRGMMRDEQVRFADFCASKTSASECDDGAVPPSDGGVVPPSDGGADAGGGPDGAAGGTGGAPGSGGSTGGSGGSGGSNGSGGSGGGAGTGGTGGTTSPPRPDAGSSRDTGSPSPPSGSGEEAGCSCSLGTTTGAAPGAAGWVILLGAGLGLWRRRRHR
jgi:MYXO-CTERM domain-containing protein